MTFFIITGTIGILGFIYSLFLFRKGGPYNPLKPDMPDDFTKLDYLPDPPPKDPVEPVFAPTAPTLVNFCRAIEMFEGGPGDANYKNNNPGNVRWNPGGYLPIYGDVKRSPAGFAIFPTFELGRLYLQNMVKGMIHKRPNETILQFISRYAPSSDGNDPLKYANFVAKRIGVDNSFKVGNLVV